MMISFMCPVNMFLQKNECFKSIILYILFMAQTKPYIAKTLLSSCLYDDTSSFVSHTYNHIAKVPNNGQYSVPLGDALSRSPPLDISIYIIKPIHTATEWEQSWLSSCILDTSKSDYKPLLVLCISVTFVVDCWRFSTFPDPRSLHICSNHIQMTENEKDCDKATFV